MPDFQSPAIEYLRQSKAIQQQIRKLNEEQEAISVKLAQTVCEIVRPTYRQWRPALEEQVYVIDIISGIYSPARVRNINGDYVRVQAVSPNHTAWYNIKLDMPCDEYEVPIFIVPETLFAKFNVLFKLREV